MKLSNQPLVLFLLEIYRSRQIIYQLVKRDLNSRFVQSYLGVVWAFVQPLIIFGILWFIFSIGFRSIQISSDVPYVVYLLTGLVAWYFFAEIFNAGANSIKEYSFLVKKINFKLYLLPFVKILSAFIVHMFFIIVIFVVLILNDVYPSIYWFQLIYYILCAVTLMLGISWVTSSISIFIPDIKQMIPILTQIGFWFTPIFWHLDMIPEKYSVYVKLNPAYYIISGYRESLFYEIWFWEHINLTLYFWVFTVISVLAGYVIYVRLKPHFAEVL